MKPRLVSLLVLLVPFAFVPVGAIGTQAGEAETGVRAVWNAQADAWNRGDLAGYMAGYWKSPDLVFFSNGSVTRGWQATLDRYRAAYQGENRHMGQLDFPELEIVVLGPDAALVRGRWHLKMPGGKESDGMTSVIFRRLPDGWRIVHDHSSSRTTG
jgi:beta-aspartyl-peptidase (threonine type)